MTIKETTLLPWFARMRRSASGIFLGILLVIGAVCLLFWNEGRAVETMRSLEEGIGAVLEVRRDRIDPGHEGSLVHISGQVRTQNALQDSRFGITTPGLRLIRIVEMYQWIESERTGKDRGEAGASAYEYRLGWSRHPEDSASFKMPAGHENPEMALKGKQIVADSARIGVFNLTSAITARIGKPKPLEILPEHMDSVHRAAGPARVKLADGKLFIGDDPLQPQLGDYRISYQLVPLQRASIIGQQYGDTLVPFITRTGRALLLVEAGQVPAARMFALAAKQNSTTSWILRSSGLVLLTIGFGLMLAPLRALAGSLPVIGWIASIGTGLVAVMASMALAAMTVSAAWLFYRPAIALIVLLLAVAGISALRAITVRRTPEPEIQAEHI